HSVGAPNTRASALALGIGVLLATSLLGAVIVLPMILAFGAVFAFCRIAMSKIGGQTGDILGASQQITEAVVLLALAATIGQTL
ncbi:MAG: adenosylcobinamide-GDP ribazoletransferase, partial [Paracoccaceae bacterium]